MNRLVTRTKQLVSHLKRQGPSKGTARKSFLGSPKGQGPQDLMGEVGGQPQQHSGEKAKPIFAPAPRAAATRSLSTLPPELGLLVLDQAMPSAILAMAATGQAQRRLAHAHVATIPTNVLLAKLTQEPTAALTRFYCDEVMSRFVAESPSGDALKPWHALAAALTAREMARREEFGEVLMEHVLLPIERAAMQRTVRSSESTLGVKLALRLQQATWLALGNVQTVAVFAAQVGDTNLALNSLDKLQTELDAALATGEQARIGTAVTTSYQGHQLSVMAALCSGQYDTVAALMQRSMYRSGNRSPQLEAALEERLFFVASRLADLDAAMALLGCGIGQVVVESRLAVHEAQLDRAINLLNDPAPSDPKEHAAVLKLHADGSLTAWATAIHEIRLQSGLPAGLHDAAQQFGAAVRSQNSAAVVRSCAELAAVVPFGWNNQLTQRQARDLAATILGESSGRQTNRWLYDRLDAVIEPAVLVPSSYSLDVQQFIFQLMTAIAPKL